MATLPAIVVALVAGGAMAWWSYRGRTAQPLAMAAAVCRTLGAALLVLLLLNPTLSSRLLTQRPLILLDHSVSMLAQRGQGSAARAAAAALGDTVAFGDLAPGEAGGRSMLGAALPAALASGRPVTVVTDGEIGDADALPTELLATTTVRLFPRGPGDDVALVEVRGPERLAAGDSLHLRVEARRVGAAPDSTRIEIRDGAQLLQAATIRLGSTGRGVVDLAMAMPSASVGLRWLEIRRVGAADAEAGDDLRWWAVRVTPSPGVVVLASAPDWDGRFLYRALRDVTEAPVRGYAQLQPGQWRRMDDLRRVPAAEVQAAARAADLLAVRGEVEPWRRSGRARLLWPVAAMAGDWYLAPSASSPVAGGFAGGDADSLPPAVAVTPLGAEATSAWVGATARLARRGSDVPVIGGQQGRDGRTVTFGADGLFRWGFRGGVSEQVWRALVADAAAWLLATPDSASAAIRPIALVTPRGRAVRFRWVGSRAPEPVAITLRDSARTRVDTLRFDAGGEASIPLPVGRYRYLVADGGGSGDFGVEPYADELVPTPVTLTERRATVATASTGRGAREWPALFLLIVLAFGAEWLLRRRLGMR
ncbi:MAG: hypothetical protein IPP98_15325 [Gemmatimonadetes bacterium]|nr:hypothetical protein [Gemmatimonadota bacterium]MBL0180465.1 hypothetical protein [Gemmatimonadota bacterium]